MNISISQKNYVRNLGLGLWFNSNAEFSKVIYESNVSITRPLTVPEASLSLNLLLTRPHNLFTASMFSVQECKIKISAAGYTQLN